MAPSTNLPIVLYHYEWSPYSRRIVWYLNLRKIPYSQCIQPMIMPRPDLEILGVKYRRVPILSIGRDVYVDSRLILQKLEALYPVSAAHPGISGAAAGEPEHTAIETLISAYTVEGGLFLRGAGCLPAELYSDPAFQRDRASFLSGSAISNTPGAASPLSAKGIAQGRPNALLDMGRWIRWLENGLLSDGRTWILDSNKVEGGGPSLADIEAAWLLHWVSTIPGSLPAEVLGAESTPKVVAWLGRISAAVEEAVSHAPAPAVLKGEDAAALVVGSPFAEPEGDVLGSDPIVQARGLRKGNLVRVWPTDYGFTHKDAGTLIALDGEETVIEAQGKLGSIRIHAPRRGFSISSGASDAASKI